MKKMIVLFMLLVGVCFGATYYVDPTGTDDGGHGTAPGTDAWATVLYAIETGCDNSEAHTVNVAAGTYTEAFQGINTLTGKDITVVGASAATTIIQGTLNYGFLLDNAGLNTGSLEFQDVTLQTTNAGSSYLFRLTSAVTDLDLIFTDCIISPHADNTSLRFMLCDAAAGATTRNITCSGCTITTKGDTYMCSLTDMGNLIFHDNTISLVSTAASQAWLCAATQKIIRITNNTITSTATGYILQLTTNTSLTSVEFGSNTTSGGGSVVGILPVSGTSPPVYMYNNTMTGFLGYAAFLGVNTDSPELAAVDNMGYVYVANNYATKSASGTAGHGLLIGKGIVAGLVSGNYIDVSAYAAGEYAVVSKADNVTFKNNICVGDKALTLKGSQNCSYVNNTCVGDGDYCLSIVVDPASAPNPEKDNVGNYLVNNIFYAVGATYNWRISDTGAYDTITDYNCYYGGTNLFYTADGDKTLATMATWWAANGTYYINTSNESHSLNIDPGLNTATYKPGNSNVTSGGMPDASGNTTPIGSIAVSSKQSSIYGDQNNLYTE